MKVFVKCACGNSSEINERSHKLAVKKRGAWRCQSCVNKEIAPRLSQEGFLKQAAKKHGDRFLYTKSVCTGTLEPITITCRIHGDFSQIAGHHIHGGSGCPKCGEEAKLKSNRSQTPERRALIRSSLIEHWERDGRKKKGSETSNKTWENQELRSRVSETTRSRWLDAAFRSKVSDKIRTAWKEQWRILRQAEKTRANWLDQNYRETISSRIRRMWENPAYRGVITLHTKQMWENPEYAAKMAVIRSQQPSVSSLNRATATLLDDLGVPYALEHPIGPWNFDLFIPSHNILIECHGEYWHSLPRCIRNDKAKATYIKRYFPELRLLEIWEVEFYKHGKLRDILTKALGLSHIAKKAVDFSSLSVKPIPLLESKTFCGIHHYLGSVRGSGHYGLFHGNALIGCCVFGSFARNEQAQKYKDAVELTRFCLHPDYQVKNLGSWFLSRCLKLVNKSVVTYADTTLGHDGALYKATNFTFLHSVESDYFYVDEGNWALHKRTVWGRAAKMGLTEADYAEKNNLKKKWGGEKLCFVYEHKQ